MNITNSKLIDNGDGTSTLPFSVSDKGYILNDAIVGNNDYINSLTSDEIINIQKQRFINWIAVLNGNN
jgi:hypothetical protein